MKEGRNKGNGWIEYIHNCIRIHLLDQVTTFVHVVPLRVILEHCFNIVNHTTTATTMSATGGDRKAGNANHSEDAVAINREHDDPPRECVVSWCTRVGSDQCGMCNRWFCGFHRCPIRSAPGAAYGRCVLPIPYAMHIDTYACNVHVLCRIVCIMVVGSHNV